MAKEEASRSAREYVQVEKPDLGATSPPKWDSVADRLTEYHFGTVQTTRGCPFDCEFCDVIYLFGRAQRHKRSTPPSTGSTRRACWSSGGCRCSTNRS